MKHAILPCLAAVLLVAGALVTDSPGYANESGARSPIQIKGGGSDSDEDDRVNAGFEIAPVPLDLAGRNPRLVGLGSYMVNAMGSCNDCHTVPNYAPGGNPFMGQPEQVNALNYLAGGRAFGPFVSRNITPLDNGMPAGRSYDEFVQIMLNGVDYECADGDPPPCPLLQVMPWPYYQDMTDQELRAIYEYLSAIPHAEPGN